MLTRCERDAGCKLHSLYILLYNKVYMKRYNGSNSNVHTVYPLYGKFRTFAKDFAVKCSEKLAAFKL